MSEEKILGTVRKNDEPKIKHSKEVDDLIKDNSRNNPNGKAASKDAAQHAKHLRHWIIFLGVTTSAIHAHRNHKMNQALKKQEQLDEAFRDASRGHGGGGRSVQEIFLEEERMRHQKKLAQMQRKWPELQRPQSFSQKTQQIFRTGASGIKEALRAQTMKGVAQAQSGSDTRALKAAAIAGSIPGNDIDIDMENQMPY